MKSFLFVLCMFPALVLAELPTLDKETGDYCLGEWPESTDVYCNGAMTYVRSLVVDRNTMQPKSQAMAHVNEAVVTFGLPITLVENYIEFVYQIPPGEFDPNSIAALMQGGCINNAVRLQKIAAEDIRRISQ